MKNNKFSWLEPIGVLLVILMLGMNLTSCGSTPADSTSSDIISNVSSEESVM